MRQLFLVLSVLLLGLTWSVAQSNSPSQSSNSSGNSTGATQNSTAGQNSQMGTGNHVTVEGCLSGTGGSYTLTAKDGMTYQLTGDTAKLSQHVGHEVKVTGMSENASGGTASAAGNASGSEHEIQVTSVKHISKTCKSGTGAMSH